MVIENLYPQANPVGLIQEQSYDFKLINKTDNDTNYILKLQKVNTPAELALTDVVYGLTKDNVSSTNLLSEMEDGIIDRGTIKGNQTINYELRFWLREDIEDDVVSNNKTLKYRISVDVSQKLTFNDLFKNKVDTNATIDFSKISSATNGRGIYKYIEDGEGIYYWRGKVEDNHVVFAGFCWEAVRTTKTGGLKMIYDGVSTIDGHCVNTGVDSEIETRSIFNNANGSASTVGYMYGSIYKLYSITSANENGKIRIYGNDVVYKDGTYRLIDTITTIGVWSTDYPNIGDGHHYMCPDGLNSCEQVNYVFFVNSGYARYIKLNNGEKINYAWQAMHLNDNDSRIKSIIEEWYRVNIEEKGFSPDVEDDIYCNDRSVQDDNWGEIKKDGNATSALYFSSVSRNGRAGSHIPSLSCNNKKDAFTMKMVNGNGKLKYSVGLLTLDEITLAGGTTLSTVNKDFYLYTNSDYWTLTPLEYGYYGGWVYFINENGVLGGASGVGVSRGGYVQLYHYHQ